MNLGTFKKLTMRPLTLFTYIFISFSLFSQPRSKEDSLKAESFFKRAMSSQLFSRDRQLLLDSALQILPSQPYYWQQKSMPLSKQKKYELAISYIDSAVKYDPTLHWREYRAFMKCIFQKSYRDAIYDFEFVKEKNEDGNVMDHTFNFYIGLCYLQLNQFEKATSYFQKSIQFRMNKWNMAHYLEYFYLGITYMELQQYDKAIINLDNAILGYRQFSDAKFYKANILNKLGRTAESKLLIEECLLDLKKGYTINEDNVIYEEYPYQIKKYWLTGLYKD